MYPKKRKIILLCFVLILSACSGISSEYMPENSGSDANDPYLDYLAEEGKKEWEMERRDKLLEEAQQKKFKEYEKYDRIADEAARENIFDGSQNTDKVAEPLDTNLGCPTGCTYHKSSCDIKGNISVDTGEQIYHMPGQKYYEETIIRPEYGERWFCTEEEAIANGWRKTKK